MHRIESLRLANGRAGLLQKEREDRGDNNRGDLGATRRDQDVFRQRCAAGVVLTYVGRQRKSQ